MVEVTWKRIGIFASYAFIVMLSDSILMYMCFRDPGPLRTYIIPEVVVYLLCVVALAKLLEGMDVRCRHLICVLGALVMSYFECKMLSELPQSVEYSVESQMRDLTIKNAADGTIVDLSALPDSHLLLSYFCNDKIWIQNVYLPYFCKNLQLGRLSD